MRKSGSQVRSQSRCARTKSYDTKGIGLIHYLDQNLNNYINISCRIYSADESQDMPAGQESRTMIINNKINPKLRQKYFLPEILPIN